MRSRVTKRGFTLIELLVVIAIIAILASILFPVFRKAKDQANKTVCVSQVRQLATAVQMYVQDNGNRYPGVNWADAIYNYVGSQKLYFCPADAANDKSQPISYGYAGILVRADDKSGAANTGCNEAQIKAPTEAGCIVDATPSRPYPSGGLVGGGALIDPTSAAANSAVEIEPRHNGCVVGFCDGHAKFFPGKGNLKDVTWGPGRAFYRVVGLGYCNNPGGGIQKVALLTPSATTVTIGGDYATYPIVQAAAEVWAANGGTWYSRGFKGSGGWNAAAAAFEYTHGTTSSYQDFRRAAAGANYCWGVADGTAAVVLNNETQIGKDAFCFIVSKNCKIPGYAAQYDTTSGTYWSSTATIAGFYAGADKGYSANSFQCYTYDKNSGSRAFAWKNCLSLATDTLGSQCLTVENDADMLDKVAADPYGIGYCSTAFVDFDKVNVLSIGGSAATAAIWPNQNPKYRFVVRDTAANTAGEFIYPFTRVLKVQWLGAGGAVQSPANYTVLNYAFTDAEFQNGPLFRATSYWVN